MTSHRVACVVGSLREGSFNRKLAEALKPLAPANLTFDDVRIADLPLYDQDDDGQPAPSVVRLKDAIRAADAVLFVTPEYNRSVPGVLKNAIDHASRPYGQSVWAGKPAGIVSASVGSAGGAMAQQHLRSILGYLDMPTLGQPEAFIQVGPDSMDEHGKLSPRTRDFLQRWMDRYVAWIERFATARAH